jgi:anti-anti-sigma factor
MSIEVSPPPSGTTAALREDAARLATAVAFERARAVITLRGALVTSTARAVTAALDLTFPVHARVTEIDLAGVSSIDGGGLAALALAERQCEARGGRLVLARPSPCAQELLQRASLTGAFCIESG